MGTETTIDNTCATASCTKNRDNVCLSPFGPVACSQRTNTYDVHIYAEVRLKVCNVRAASMPEAIRKAEDNTDLYEAFGKKFKDSALECGLDHAEYAETIHSYKVDVVGDKEYIQTRDFEPDGDEGFKDFSNSLTEQPSIIIEINGGNAVRISSTTPDLKVYLVDRDNLSAPGADIEEEIETMMTPPIIDHVIEGDISVPEYIKQIAGK